MIKVYGASDDLIEVDGDIVEEFNVDCDESNYVALSNGVVLRVKMDEDGDWTVKVVSNPNMVSVIISKREESDDGVAEVEGDVTWVLHGLSLLRK
jgi:hypothetical protein